MVPDHMQIYFSGFAHPLNYFNFPFNYPKRTAKFVEFAHKNSKQFSQLQLSPVFYQKN